MNHLQRRSVWACLRASAAEFYKAEQYHQDYYRNNPQQGYCRVVIGPKLEKFRKVFKDKLKASD